MVSTTNEQYQLEKNERWTLSSQLLFLLSRSIFTPSSPPLSAFCVACLPHHCCSTDKGCKAKELLWGAALACPFPVSRGSLSNCHGILPHIRSLVASCHCYYVCCTIGGTINAVICHAFSVLRCRVDSPERLRSSTRVPLMWQRSPWVLLQVVLRSAL